MSSYYGKNIHFSIFGQSHSEAIGVVIDGLPSGFKIDFDYLQSFLDRRRPGTSTLTTARNEADKIEILSGIVDERLCGAPLSVVIKNTNTISKDYDNIRKVPRPGHSDYTAHYRYEGYNDVSGGGHFSGRLTAPLCVVGGIILQILKKEGIEILSHLASIRNVDDELFSPLDPKKDFSNIKRNELPVINSAIIPRIFDEIRGAKNNLDSVGGVIECACVGLPKGIGSPMFNGLENIISNVVFAVPAVKGIEFGAGFMATKLYGSENNDPYYMKDNAVMISSNNAGGILGGISTGFPIIFRVAMKPTSSISIPQSSINLETMTDEELIIKGRHDPCVAVRAVPVIEAAAAIGIYDEYLSSKHYLH